MYLLQPMVNYLCKPPRRWCDKCVKRRGEICCEGCFRVTKVQNISPLLCGVGRSRPVRTSTECLADGDGCEAGDDSAVGNSEKRECRSSTFLGCRGRNKCITLLEKWHLY